MSRVDVAVIGTGIIGLSAAWHLARLGRTVAVLGDQRPGTATHAAVGMLTPTCEWETYEPRAWLEFLQESARYYPEFLRRLDLEEQDFDPTVGYRGLDFVVLDFHQRPPALEAYAQLASSLGSDCDYLPPTDTVLTRRNLDTALIRGGMRVRGEAIVDPRRFSTLLRNALDSTTGVALIDAAVIASDTTASDAITLRDSTGRAIEANHVLIAAGAWSAEAAALFDLDVPIFPVKGQIIELAGPPGLVPDVLYMPVGACGCLLERSPGQYICGTSEEYRDGCATNTVEVIATILDRARQVLPASGRWTITDMWSGFRPQAADRMPLIGATADPRISLATGHFRNGILAGPHTGRVIANYIAGTNTVDLSPYSPTRALSAPVSIAARF